MLTKTIEYGTKLRATVVHRDDSLLVATGEDGEGYALMGSYDGYKGALGTLEFRRGGPMAGHWHFTPDANTACSYCEGPCEDPYTCPHCNAVRPCGDGSHCQECYRNNDPDWCNECEHSPCYCNGVPGSAGYRGHKPSPSPPPAP